MLHIVFIQFRKILLTLRVNNLAVFVKCILCIYDALLPDLLLMYFSGASSFD